MVRRSPRRCSSRPESPALAFNAASYFVSYYAIRSIDFPAEPVPTRAADVKKRKFWRELADGAQLLIRNRVIFGILVCAMVCQIGVGALNTLDVFFVTRNLHVAAKNFGYMAIAMGAGLILGSLVAPRVVRRLGPATTTTCAMLAAGIIYAIYARQTTFAAGLVVLVLLRCRSRSSALRWSRSCSLPSRKASTPG